MKIKGGATPRIEAEMALIRLCEPKLETSVDAVIERVSRLERAIANGIKTEAKPEIQKTEVPQETLTETPQTASEEVQKETVTVTETEENPPEPTEPVTAETIPEPPKEPVVPQPEIKTEPTQIEFKHWGEFIDELRKLDITLFGILSGSRGFIRDDVFLIDSPNPTIRDFIKKNNSARTIKTALYNVTGMKYKLGVMKHNNGEQTKRDPLEDLIAQAQGKINIDVK